MSSVVLTDARVTEGHLQYTLQKKLIEEHVWRCCDNCGGKTLRDNASRSYVCVYNDMQPIPPQVIALGCGKWDDLPF